MEKCTEENNDQLFLRAAFPFLVVFQEQFYEQLCQYVFLKKEKGG